MLSAKPSPQEHVLKWWVLITNLPFPKRATPPLSYLDTSATHHLTFDLNNLNIQSEAYDGIDAIQVENGTCLAIKNTGISKVFPNFILHHILHVPKLTKNLLMIIMSIWNFIHLLFLLWIVWPGKFYTTTWVEMAHIIGSLVQLHHLVFFFPANELPLWTGTLALAIPLNTFFVMFCFTSNKKLSVCFVC